MTHQVGRMLGKFIPVAALIVLLLAPRAWAESYSSSGSHYPKDFSNNIFDTNNNDMEYMDAVYFGGKELILFTLFSDEDDSLDSKLYYYTSGYDYHGSLDIGNSQDLDMRFKTCVLNDVLYIFYTTSYSEDGFSAGTIYYRTVTIDYGSTGTGWSLVFSGQKSISTGLSSKIIIRVAALMNGTMHIIYTGHSSPYAWYDIPSADGLTFNAATQFYTSVSGTINGAGGAVFQVPDAASGCVEKFMLAYALESSGSYSLHYFFYDGTTAYGASTAPNLGSLTPYSVRLIAGSASGYTSDKYTVQAWLTTPHSETYSSIYHAEYIPEGTNGDEGSWSSAWTFLKNNDDDMVHCLNAYDADPYWAVIPYFKKENNDVRMYIHIWYSRGTNYSWPSSDTVELRYSSYQSDLLQYDTTVTVSSATQDLTTSTILGVIEGTPPFPVNGGVPEDDGANTSTVELAATAGMSTSTAVTVGGTVVASYGGEFLGMGVETKLSAGLRYTKDEEKSYTLSTSYSLHSFIDETPGDLGWVLVLKPEIVNAQYVLKSYSGAALAYGDTSGDEFRMSIIQYGSGSTVETYAYKLLTPSTGFSYSSVFAGMIARPLSTDLDSWQTVTQYYLQANPSYTMQQLFTLSGSQGSTGYKKIESDTASGSTYSPSAGFSASAQLLGFSADAKVNFAMKITTKTSMQNSLGFYYNLPNCSDSACCIAKVDITPSILVPASDSTGYSAPWISDDIRNYEKPKPWLLSYLVYPDGACNASLTQLRLKKASGKLHLDRTQQNRDTMTADLTFKGIPPSFSLADDQLMHLRFGNYVINSDANLVDYRGFQGQDLLMEFKERANSNSTIWAKFMYDSTTSVLRIQLDAHQVDLGGLRAYKFKNNNTPSATAMTLPYDLFIGGKYYASGKMDLNYTSKKNKWSKARILGPHVK